ncbi:PIN domain-containing protein [bacterium]|nr:PIN domain-containing protein [bacterium]
MKKVQKEIRYWDSDCFLGMLKGESDKKDLCKTVLEEAKEGNIMIVTSALTIAEVLYIKGKSPIPVKDKDKVVLFFRSDYIAVKNVTIHIAEFAREIVWSFGIKPKDAIHISTAMIDKIKLFNTFDEHLLSKNIIAGNPALVIEKPQVNQPKLPFENT